MGSTSLKLWMKINLFKEDKKTSNFTWMNLYF